MTNKIMPKVNREGRRSFLQKSIAVVATGVVTHAFSAPNITLEKDTKPQPGTCILSVEQMAGPYIKSNMPIRRNIAENENMPGVLFIFILPLSHQKHLLRRSINTHLLVSFTSQKSSIAK